MASNAGAGPAYYCHECQQSIQPLMAPGPTCPRCNGQFVEELESVQSSIANNVEEEDEDDDAMAGIHSFFGGPAGVREGRPYMDHTAQPFDLGGLLRGVLGNLANAGNEPRQNERTGSDDRSALDRNDGNQGEGSSYRGGAGSFGPINFRWGYSTQPNATGSHATFRMGGGNPPGRSASVPPTLNEFLRGSFPQGHPNEHDDHVHDDGMGGAGGAADGRFFNHDNPHNRFDEQENGSNARAGHTELHPELATLRQVFGNLFGDVGNGPAGALVSMLGDSLLSGRSGDYVFGQQGLDDVITQLMEQTRGTTAPPPASDEVIQKLDRFSRKNLDKVRQARNRECSTCMDSFEDEEDRGKTDASLDSNRPVEAAGEVNDDPPEVAPDSADQQDELVMMPCRHLFHEDCLVPWLKTSGTCPVCRVRLDGVPEHPGGEEQRNAATSTSSTTAADSSAPAAAASSDAIMSDARSASPTQEDLDSETPEQRRSRMLRAAEARAGHSQPTMPGSFGQPPPADDLD